LSAEIAGTQAHVPVHGRDKLLDAWRGISVLLVVLYHLVEYRFEPLFRPDSDGGLSPPPFSVDGIAHWLKHEAVRELEYAGPLGVQIFFVISGYIITTLLLREYKRNGRISLAAFYVRRAFRILPPLWLMLGATFIFASLGYIIVDNKSFLFAGSFLCNMQPGSCSWFTGHTWSLATEEQFYLVWPLLLTMIGCRAVAPVALALCLLFIVADQAALLTISWLHNALSGACIAAGALYASSETFRSLISRAANLPVILLAVVLLFGEPFLQHFFHGLPKVENALTPFLIVFVIFSCFRFRASLESRTDVRVLSAIGLASYGLYLWQQMFLGKTSFYLRSSILNYAPVCALVVVLSYYLVEMPFVRVGAQLSRKLIERETARTAASTTIAP
jgi:peptidoglycan/LPS O-acetylase OafA/YrhL